MNKDDIIIETFDKLPDAVKRNLPQSALDKMQDKVDKRTAELQQEIVALRWKKAHVEQQTAHLKQGKDWFMFAAFFLIAVIVAVIWERSNIQRYKRNHKKDADKWVADAEYRFKHHQDKPPTWQRTRNNKESIVFLFLLCYIEIEKGNRPQGGWPVI